MTGKLPWATAAILIVAAVTVGTWAIFSTPTQTTPPTTGEWHLMTSTVGFTTDSPKSGIAAVFIAKVGSNQHYDENWLSLAGTDNYYYKFTTTTQSGNIPYETPFVFMITVVGNDDNLAYIENENLSVGFSVTAGSWTLAKTYSDNGAGSDGTEIEYYASDGENIGINAVWDNNGNYFDIPAGGSIDWAAELVCWS